MRGNSELESINRVTRSGRQRETQQTQNMERDREATTANEVPVSVITVRY
jgi:hypothetical protein